MLALIITLSEELWNVMLMVLQVVNPFVGALIKVISMALYQNGVLNELKFASGVIVKDPSSAEEDYFLQTIAIRLGIK